ncbi:MAG TPA: Crp/Fnr family transcriptional regulator [Propylenella sp.]|nr:Crp/Fnr family transcriptional regulator [Propylenella sp.]
MTEPHPNPLIRKFEHLYPLTAEEKRVLDSVCARTERFHADHDVVRIGDMPKECNLLLEGIVFRYEITPEGKRQIMSFQFPGDIFDAQSFVLDEMDHSIATLTPCKVGVIPHGTMREITEDFPRIARALWKDTLVDAAVFRKWLVSLGRKSAPQRIAHLMCEISLRLQAVNLNRGPTIDWPYTQAEIGDALGLSNVHVNRSMQTLRKGGSITLRNGTLTINDFDRLRDIGQFDPAYLHLRGNGGWLESRAR